MTVDRERPAASADPTGAEDAARPGPATRDVAELERALARAESAEARLRRAFDSSLIGILTFQMGGPILEVNDAFLKMVGYRRDELLAPEFDSLTLVVPEGRDDSRRAVGSLSLAGEVLPREKEYLHKDGTHIPVLASIVKVADSDECIAIVADLRARKAVECTLRQSERRLRGLFDAAPIGAIFTDLGGRIERANPAFCRLVGYTEAELTALTFTDLTHSDDQAGDLPAARALTSGEVEVFQREKRYRHKDGHYIWVLILASVIRDEQGVPVGFAAQAQDIGERKRMDQELLRSESRLRAIMDTAHDGILTTDDHAIIRYANSAMCDISGYPMDELIGLDSNLLLPVHSREKNRRELALFRETGRPLALVGSRVEFQTLRKDGTSVPVEISLTSWTVEGETFFAGIARNVSDRKRAETELIRAKVAAEEAARAKSAFLARMSHEIRTPMNGVWGMIDLALRTALSPVQRDYLETARSSAAGLLSVINDVLDFSKIEAGKLDLAHEPFSFEQCLEGAVRAVAPLSNAKGLEVLLSISADVPDGLVGDPWRLRQVLVNLLSNAIKFTDRGEIGVNARCLDWNDGGVTLEVRVTDTGIGIAPGEHDAVFDVFRQAEETATRRFGGTGLGLAICAQLVKLMNGTIGVESALGQGSTFHFTARFGLDATATAPVGPVELQGVPALVVIPMVGLRGLVSRLLSRWRLRPVAFESCEQAAQVVRSASTTFKLLLVDQDAPGAETLAAELGALAGAELRVIRFSGDPMMAALDGAPPEWLCLSKPVTPTALLEAVRRAVASGGGEEAAPLTSPQPPASSRPLRVLLAEDNPVNARIARILLESAGHSVVPALNGRLALAAFAAQVFDVVLMDVQMPELDGIEATRTIRAQEAASKRHTPIVALTAQAVRGDREACLAAGADDYLAKPFSAKELFEVVERVTASAPLEQERSGAVPASGPAAATSPVHEALAFDPQALLDKLGRDEMAALEIVAVVVENVPLMRAELEASLLAGDRAAIRAMAHKMKGMFLSVGGRRAAELAEQLEAAGDGPGKNGDYDGQALCLEIDRFLAEISRWEKARQPGDSHQAPLMGNDPDAERPTRSIVLQ